MTEARRVVIAAACPEDATLLAALAAGSLREAWSASSFVGILDVPGTVCLAARVRGAASLVGFVLAQRVLDELHVLSLAVAPASRRAGLARALLTAALGEPPAKRVLLEVRPSNEAALGFYRALGFEEVGRRRSYYPDGEDALLLTRGEEPGAAAKASAGGRRA